MFGNFVLFVALSLLPSAVIFAVAWVVGKRADSSTFAAKGLASVLSLGIGFGIGWVMLGSLADSPAALVLFVLVLAGVFVALSCRAAFLPMLVSALSFMVGSHLAVAVRNLGQGGSEDGQGVFWAMPILDLWLIIGVPVLLAVFATFLVRKLRASRLHNAA